MDIINKYFGDLWFYRVDEKDMYAIYAAAIDTMLIGERCSHVIAFVPIREDKGITSRLCDISWRNLQLRTLPNKTYKIKLQRWRAPVNSIPEIMFYVTHREKTYSSYTASNIRDFPYELLMLNSPKKPTIYQYPNNFNIHWAVDQFNMVLNYVEPIKTLVPELYEPPSHTNIEWL
jgi:hypothetical protein